MIIQLLIALVLIATFTLILVKILREGKKNEENKEEKLVFKEILIMDLFLFLE